MKSIACLSLPLALLLLAGCDKSQPKDTPPAPSPTVSERAANAVDKTKAAASDAKDAISAKLVEWKLTPSDIKEDLAKTGRVVREKTLAAGEKVGGTIDNARIVAVVNGKYIADSDLSSLKINVDADNGVVTLNGTVDSLDLVGRAVALALNTEGVTQVVGLLKVADAAPITAEAPGSM